MSPKRLLVLLALVAAAATVLASAAPAGGIRDWEPCPDQGGILVCPQGTEGVHYAIKFRAVEEPPCQPGEDFWHFDGGSPPPGLSLASDGTLSGTPTQAGTFTFWVEMELPDNDHCNGTADTTQEQFQITIKPGVPRLVIGPEQSGVPVATVSSPYSLQMTATVSDPKTWSIAAGALPTGLTLGASTGLISGTPTTAGTYAFTVRAEIDPQRVDTKTLAITVRSPILIARQTAPESEVGVPLVLPLTATGGTESFTWSLTAGALPPGVLLGPTGAIAGKPTAAGTFAFTATATDTEHRTASHSVTLTVAERLALAATRPKPAKVGRFYQLRLRTTGGVELESWRVKRGPLPRGMSFDRDLGLLYGTPKRARTYRVAFEARDTLGVKASATVVLVVKAAPKPPKKR